MLSKKFIDFESGFEVGEIGLVVGSLDAGGGVERSVFIAEGKCGRLKADLRA